LTQDIEFLVGVSCLEADVSIEQGWLGYLNDGDMFELTIGQETIITISEPIFSSSGNTSFCTPSSTTII
jgi:hypothetical protein